MKKYQVFLEDQTIEYELCYKNIRSLYLKVEQGKLVVKAPLAMSRQTIEHYIFQYQKKILKQINNYRPYALLEDGGYVDIYGKCYSLVLRDVQRKECALHENQLYVYDGHVKECVSLFLKQRLYSYVEERVIFYLATYFDLDMPRILIKTYKGRWGSCFYKENTISFHLGLVHLEPFLIDYVIVHELTHFLQPNHSRLFYQQMSQVMPDYKQRQRLLKEKHV